MANLVALQMVSSPDVEDNFSVIEHHLRTISPGALVVLPECCLLFGAPEKASLDLSEPFKSGQLQQRLSELARRYQVWLVAGTIPIIAPKKNKFTASSLIFNDRGECVAHYQKMHLFDVTVDDNTKSYNESKFTQAGDSVVVIDSPFGKLGVAVCYDLRFSGLFAAMLDVDVIALPAAFTQVTGKAHWLPLLQARAIEKQCYLVAAGQGGIHANSRETFGHSCIVSPWGDILAHIDKGHGIAQSLFDKSTIERIRTSIPVSHHNRFRSHLD